ncbi:MAG: YutD family protein [Bacilli bacterium]|nr:YutD family protein [Bacilli bacterium]
MKNSVEINGKQYEIVRNDGDCFDLDLAREKMTDYFDDYDYVFGDFAYEKVRFKGFYDSKNKKAKRINDIKYLEDYIKEYCSFGAKVFLLKKMK